MKNILFDLDGTIIESEEGIINSILYAVQKMGIEEAHKEELKTFIGPPLIDSFKKRYELNTEQAGHAVAYYREYFSTEGIHQNILYDGIEALLNVLHQQAVNLFIATSKPTVFAKKILLDFKLSHLFQDIIGSNLNNTRIDKTEIIKFIFDQYNLNAAETIMIGDTKFDMIGAKVNGILAIGVTYGHGSVDDLKSNDADYLVSNCAELGALIGQL